MLEAIPFLVSHPALLIWPQVHSTNNLTQALFLSCVGHVWSRTPSADHWVGIFRNSSSSSKDTSGSCTSSEVALSPRYHLQCSLRGLYSVAYLDVFMVIYTLCVQDLKGHFSSRSFLLEGHVSILASTENQ